MSSVVSYDAGRGALLVGDGGFAPVRSEVLDYSVGGKNIVRSWFNYRKKDPGGKSNYPLDLVHPEAWEPEWTAEPIDLLTVITHLAELQPGQEELTARVVEGRLLTTADLEKAGTRWPKTKQDRNPRCAYSSLGTQHHGL